MSDTITPAATTAVPTTPAIATTSQVAAHATLVQNAISALEAAPQNAANAEAYLNLKAEAVTSWVSAKHVKTRLIEVAALAFVIGVALGALIISHL